MTIDETIGMLRAGLKAPAQDPKFEGLVAGSGTGALRGVATCFAPSMEVLRAAADAGCNLILSDAHPFFLYDSGYGARQPNVTAVEGSAVTAAKRKFIDDHGMAVFRIRSAWDAARPVDAAKAYAATLGWRDAQAMQSWAVQPLSAAMSLSALLAELDQTQGLEGVRVIADPQTRVSKAAIYSGLITPARLGAVLADPSIDLIVAGEANEWEGGPYVEDAIASGRRVALVLTGFAVSREPMAQALATWAGGVLPQVTVRPFMSKPAIWSVG